MANKLERLSENMLIALSRLSDKEFLSADEIGLNQTTLQCLKKRNLVESKLEHGTFNNLIPKIKWRLLPMTKKEKKWIDTYREFVGKKIYSFNFNKFFKDTNITVEKFAELIGYTVDGVIKMIQRGTIKIKTYEVLEQHFNNLNKYIIKTKRS